MKPAKALVFIVACLLWGEGWAGSALRCLIEPERVADVGSSVVGIIESIHVERGDSVRQGQILAQLRADVERASVGVAAARAKAEADVRAALTNYEYLRQKQVRAEELVQKNFISQQALEQARAETDVAQDKLAQAREQQQVWQRELDLAQAQLGLRAIRAPFDGVIAERYVSVGERIEEKPMFRVAKVDPLRVEVVVPAAMFGLVHTGMIAKVTPDLSTVAVLDAKVVLVDKLVDAASNTFRVRAELPNAGARLPSGLRCKADLPERAAAAPAAMPGAEGPVQKQRVGLRLDSELSFLREQAGAPRRVQP